MPLFCDEEDGFLRYNFDAFFSKLLIPIFACFASVFGPVIMAQS